ncbi:hypothetical protein F2Q70_00026123 [Brassica cretica]|uniref:Uncharacterized protein n=2 Tax=Brassica cretica TaxID=69181 RepID=A0A8S9I6N4_BRACR|nr:hypothetical protein F2Q68_00025684 [Brassica cretica]KAF2601508.1 hypothetical protein F2Q70_00026123 [Brassica cretica]KAF3579915.1 hypothetical protein DY000_02031620 [Brassica cretica]
MVMGKEMNSSDAAHWYGVGRRLEKMMNEERCHFGVFHAEQPGGNNPRGTAK